MIPDRDRLGVGTSILGIDPAIAMRQITTMGRWFDLGLGWFIPAKRR